MHSLKNCMIAGAAALSMLAGCVLPVFPEACFAVAAADAKVTETLAALNVSRVGVDFADITLEVPEGDDSIVSAAICEGIPEGTDLTAVVEYCFTHPDDSSAAQRAALVKSGGEEMGKLFDLYESCLGNVGYEKITSAKMTFSELKTQTAYTVIVCAEKDDICVVKQLQFTTKTLPVIRDLAVDLVEHNGFAVKWEIDGDDPLSYVVVLYEGIPELDPETFQPATADEMSIVLEGYETMQYVDMTFPSGSTLRYGKGGLTGNTLYTVAVMPIANAEHAEAVPAWIQVRTPLMPGDVNGDGGVNASDAAKVLIAAAQLGASKPSGLTEAEAKVADVNSDTSINATDAALILQYAAYIGDGNEAIPLEDFLSKQD